MNNAIHCQINSFAKPQQGNRLLKSNNEFPEQQSSEVGPN